MLLKIIVEVLRVVTPCSDAVGYQRFGEPCCLHLQGGVKWIEGLLRKGAGGEVFRNVGILPQHYTASKHRRPSLEFSSPWKPQISHLA